MKSFLSKFNVYNECLSSKNYIFKVTKIHLRPQKNIGFKSFHGKYKYYGFLKNLISSTKKKKKLFLIKRRRKFRFSKLKRASLKTESYILEELDVLVNSLKKKIKFQNVEIKDFYNCCIYFKYTGSNIYGTITKNTGEVVFIYSGGFFQGLRTRRQKSSFFVAQSLGELIAVRLYKTNASEIFFIPLLKNFFFVRKLLIYMGYGFKLIRAFRITKVILKRRIIRNGVRLRKMPRK